MIEPLIRLDPDILARRFTGCVIVIGTCDTPTRVCPTPSESSGPRQHRRQDHPTNVQRIVVRRHESPIRPLDLNRELVQRAQRCRRIHLLALQEFRNEARESLVFQ